MKLTKGNYKKDDEACEKPIENSSTSSNEFEPEVLAQLGGSVAFVRPKKGGKLIEPND